LLRTFRTRITTRVVALSAAVSLLLGLVLVVLIVAVSGQRDAALTLFRSQQALSVANELEKSLLLIENSLGRYVTTGNERFLVSVNRALEDYPRQRDRLAQLVSDDPGQQQQVRQIGDAIDEYAELWAGPVIDIARDDLAKAADQVTTNAGRSRLDPIRRNFGRLFTRERAVIDQRELRAESLSALAIKLGIGGLSLVVVIAIGFTMFLRRSVVRPVLSVADATGRLASGDLATRVRTDREDELGDLARGFNSMADSLERGREELEHSNAELTRSNAELEQFASVTSHDLQAPLTTISMYAELLERRRGPEADGDGPDLVEGIREATQQARLLIRDLLEYSRSGRGRLSLEEIPAGKIVDQALEALAGAIGQSGAQVTVGEMPTVLADRANLCRVFQNLVGNAIKFTNNTPQVRIEAERDNALWRFSVRDNGIGMTLQQTKRIFEPFQRLHGEEDYPGTGIGLAVCQRIIDQHGGRIWVSSIPGEGSVFWFTLPAVAAAPARSQPDGATPVRAKA
jgi:signal transduction histidine kinase